LRDYISDRVVIGLAIASAIVTANAYYIHPIIAPVAADFEVSAAQVGAVPAFNQFALALGILLLLPLGDRFSNRRLVPLFLAAQVGALALMTVAQSFWLFVTGSALLGFFTVAPYLLPAFVSKRVPPERLGHVTAILTTGVIAGVLLSRTGSGVIAEYLGWRSVYGMATVLMLASVVVLPILMREDSPPPDDSEALPYSQLLSSLFGMLRANPQIMVSGIIQGLSFAIFLVLWLGLGLHLTSPEMGYGTDTVGYLAAIAAINLLTTTRFGRLADRLGAHRARLLMVLIQMVGVLLLFPAGNSIWLLLIPLTLMNISGPVIDISGRMTVLDQPPQIRTRLMTLYIVFMFLGGGLGSWSGTIAYDLSGWAGTTGLAAILSLLVVCLAYFAKRQADKTARETR
jgi:predicted MFS family arabinose efflux permease